MPRCLLRRQGRWRSTWPHRRVGAMRRSTRRSGRWHSVQRSYWRLGATGWLRARYRLTRRWRWPKRALSFAAHLRTMSGGCLVW